MVRQADLLAQEQAILDASQQSPRTRRKKKAPQRAASQRDSAIINRAKVDIPHSVPAAKVPSGTTAQVQPQPQPVPPPVREEHAYIEEPAVKAIISSPRIDAKRLEQQRSREALEVSRIGTPAVPTPTPATSDGAWQGIRRQPSVVREETEPEDEEEKKNQAVVSCALNSVPERWRSGSGAEMEGYPRASAPQPAVVPSNNFSIAAAATVTDQRTRTVTPAEVSKKEGPKPGAVEHGRAAQVSRERTSSNSPARQTHFGPVQENLTVRHSPPPRSISPRKSAMKHTSPSRELSPSGNTSEASGSFTQEAAPVARKKSVRVSFDDASTLVANSSDQNDAPRVASPQHADRHSWFSGLGRRRKELPPLDDDEVMKPRPALPSFGSIRERKARETSPIQGERPLVRPKGEPMHTPPLLPSPPLGPSNDHAIGSILSREPEDSFRHPANTSRLREPLPPVVTSVEGTGYLSDSSDASSIVSSEFGHPKTVLPTTVPVPAPEQTPEGAVESETVQPPLNGSVANTNGELGSSQVPEGNDDSVQQSIPLISVSQPTQSDVVNRAHGQNFVDVPGGFPEDESDRSTASNGKQPTQVAEMVNPVETMPGDDGSAQLEPAVQATQPANEEDSSDSESSIYSDAYEDLSEIDGGGFQSLDAVVESPVQQSPQPPPKSEHVPKDNPPQEKPREEDPPVAVAVPVPRMPEEPPQLRMDMSSATTAVETSPVESPQDDWEKAKAYWRSLTAEKRAQLEREAREEAGMEADMEHSNTETKERKKKSVERRNSERRALVVQLAQQKMAQQRKPEGVDPERSYMIKPGARWTVDDAVLPPMRTSMRTEPQERAMKSPVGGTRLRKSMRTSGSGLSDSEALVIVHRAAANRPASSHTNPAAPTGGHRQSATFAGSQAMQRNNLQPPLERRGSTGSESSFKRSRQSLKGQGLGFRQSMRPTSPPSTQDDIRSSKRFSLRTLSPTGSTSKGPPVSMSTNTMRRTLRESSTGRKSPTGIRMPSFSLGKKSGAKLPRSKASGSRFSSRLPDSSDEEDGGNTTSGFRSRFEDSSDDEPVPVAIPVPAPALPESSSPSYTPAMAHSLRKQSSVASTALPEELEESEETQDAIITTTKAPIPPTQPAALDPESTTLLRRTRSGRGQLLPSSQTAPSALGTTAMGGRSPSTKRNSILSSVLRRKKRDTAAGGVTKGDMEESAARRDTRLERSVGQLRGLRGNKDEGSPEGGRDGEGEGEREEGEMEIGVGKGKEMQMQRPPPLSPRGSRLQKQLKGKKGGADKVLETMSATTASPFAADPQDDPFNINLAGGPSVTAPSQNRQDLETQEDIFGAVSPLKRHPTTSMTSSNLGTRTLSGGSLHMQTLTQPRAIPHPQRRVSSLGIDGPATPSVDGSVAGSLAGASSTTRRKRFGALRRMFGLDE